MPRWFQRPFVLYMSLWIVTALFILFPLIIAVCDSSPTSKTEAAKGSEHPTRPHVIRNGEMECVVVRYQFSAPGGAEREQPTCAVMCYWSTFEIDRAAGFATATPVSCDRYGDIVHPEWETHP